MSEDLNRGIKMRRSLTEEQREQAGESVFNVLSDALFDKVNLLNNPGLSVSPSVTSTSVYDTNFRVIDTTGGLHIRPDKISRLRMSFYVSPAIEDAQFYILSPALYNGSSLSSGISNVNEFEMYSGVFVDAGEVHIVSKGNSVQSSVKSNTTLSGDTTYIVDILYNLSNVDVYINNDYVGGISVNEHNPGAKYIGAYPLICPIRSKSGTSVKLTSENYQFIQDR